MELRGTAIHRKAAKYDKRKSTKHISFLATKSLKPNDIPKCLEKASDNVTDNSGAGRC